MVSINVKGLTAEVYERLDTPGSWGVEAVNDAGDGEVFLVVFSGPDARKLAVEYAEIKYNHVVVRSSIAEQEERASEHHVGQPDWYKLSDGKWHHILPYLVKGGFYIDGVLHSKTEKVTVNVNVQVPDAAKFKADGTADGEPAGAASRAEVYDAINGERDYQDRLPPSRSDGGDRSVGDYVTMLQYYQSQLAMAWTMCPGDDAALEVMRKIGGIAVHCMEDHGAPPRREPVRKPKDPVFFKPSGTWWHADETWSEEHGPFSTEDAARASLKDYCTWLNRDAEECRGPVYLASGGKWWYVTDEIKQGPFDTEEEATRDLKRAWYKKLGDML